MLTDGRNLYGFPILLLRVFGVFCGQMAPDLLTAEHTEGAEKEKERGSVQL